MFTMSPVDGQNVWNKMLFAALALIFAILI